MTDYLNIQMTPQEIGAVSNLGLAHIGDCVYEMLVRSYIVVHGGVTNQKMHQCTVDIVRAPAQAAAGQKGDGRLKQRCQKPGGKKGRGPGQQEADGQPEKTQAAGCGQQK